jgi:CBS-domain-containing membrane protein
MHALARRIAAWCEPRMACRIIARWGTPHRPAVSGFLWMAILFGGLCWLARRHGGILLVPPFAATLTILIYLPQVSIAQPFAVVVGSTCGAAIGTAVSAILGGGPAVATAAALAALVILPLLRAYHPPGVALAMYPALLHPGPWFAADVVLPFAAAAVGSAALLSRALSRWPRYPSPLLGARR